MKRIVAISCLGVIGMLGITCLLAMNNSNENTEKITTAIEEKAPINGETKETVINNYETTNNYETHNHYEEVTKEVVETVDEEEVKEMVHDAYFEERVKEAEETSNQLTYEELQALIYDGNEVSENSPTNSVNTNTGFRSVLQCEVCEQTGTELEVWYDVNNIKHYTCKNKCTNGLDVLYGR
jgi:tRNA G10  N-methylase Trm11